MAPSKPHFTRRQFLKFCSLGALAAVLPRAALSKAIAKGEAPQLGRALQEGWPVFAEPSRQAELKTTLHFDQIIPILENLQVSNPNGGKENWYRLAEDEYTQSAFIQPVENRRNVSHEAIPPEGRLGEITVPAIDVYTQPRGQRAARRYYYSSTFWVRSRVLDEVGVPWYELPDEINGLSYYVRAYAVHLVTPEEVAPLSADVPPEQKRVLVDLRAQRATAFEGEQEVFSAQVSAGLPATFTPLGSFQTNRKRPSRRMVSNTGNPNADYDFPGVPWVSYLTLNGIAFHGAFWHANWGQPMSHGCIEMTPPDAKWLYRWTTPAVPVNERYHEAPSGTHVDVVSGY